MSRTRNFSVDDANEARAATTRPMYLHLSEPRGLMEKRSAPRDNWSQFPDLIDIVLDKYLEGVS